MDKKEFKELTGEDPEDVLGNDYQNDYFEEEAKAMAIEAGLDEDEAERAVEDFEADL